MITNKYSSATLVAQQAADVSQCFKIVKTFCKNKTAEHIPAFSYKAHVIEELEKSISAWLLTMQLLIKRHSLIIW